MLNAYIYVIAALGCNMCDGAEGAGREHNFMFIDEGVFVDFPEYITARNMVSDLV